MSDDIEDLLADTPPPRRPGRPRKPVAPPEPPKRRGRPPKNTTPLVAPIPAGPMVTKLNGDPDNLGDGELPEAGAFYRPCSKTFLSRVLRCEPRRLDNKLSACPIIGYDDAKRPLYDFVTAISYVVEPKVDIAAWLRSQNPAHLPVAINKAFWDAEVQKLRWMERARHYWHDDDVLEVLGRCALAIKEASQLWIENLPGKEKMTSEQFESMQANVTEMLKDIHERLVEIPKERKTRPVSRSADELSGGMDTDE